MRKHTTPALQSINEQIDMSRKIGIPRDEILNDFMDLYRATNVFWEERERKIREIVLPLQHNSNPTFCKISKNTSKNR